MSWVRARICELQKRVHLTRSRKWSSLPLFAYGRWFSPGTPASSISKTGRHDIAESGIKHNKSNQIAEISKWNKIWYLT